MINWLFTKFRELPSQRLRYLARGLQGYGIAIGVATTYLALALATAPTSKIVREFRDVGSLRLLLIGVLQCASLIVIGRALLRRRRWGGYLAVITLTAPILSRLISGNQLLLPEVLIAVGACTTLLTVWKELRSARDLDLSDDDDQLEPAQPDPIPSRGYGEPRLLIEPIPITTSAAASTPLPINNPRAN